MRGGVACRCLLDCDKMADAAADLEDNGLVRTLKDLGAGAAGGIAQVLLGRCFLFSDHLDGSKGVGDVFTAGILAGLSRA